MSKKELIFDEIIDLLALRLSNSAVIGYAIAEKVKSNPDLIDKLLKGVTPDLLARAIATELFRLNDTSPSIARAAGVGSLMKDAKERAAQIIAEEMTASAAQA